MCFEARGCSARAPVRSRMWEVGQRSGGRCEHAFNLKAHCVMSELAREVPEPLLTECKESRHDIPGFHRETAKTTESRYDLPNFQNWSPESRELSLRQMAMWCEGNKRRRTMGMDASLAQDKVVRLTNGEEILLEVTTSDLVRDFKRKLLERLGKDSNKCAVDLAYNAEVLPWRSKS